MEDTNQNTNSLAAFQPIQIPPQFEKLSNLLEERAETLACGNQDIQAAALDAAKLIFDLSVQSEESSRPHIGELLAGLSPSQAPRTRSKDKTNPNKENFAAEAILFDLTPLKSLFVDGMDEDQIWAQLDLRTQAICKMLDFVLEGNDGNPNDGEYEQEDDSEEEEDEDREEILKNAIKALQEDGEDIDMDEFIAKYGLGDDDEDDESLDDEEDEMDEEISEQTDEDEEEGFSPLRDHHEENDTPHLKSIPRKPASRLPQKKRGGHPELDDGFFNLSEFNAETERAESKSSSRGRLSAKDDDSEDDEMDIDLFATVDPTESSDEENLEDHGELFYKDFFEPPSRSASAPSPLKPKMPSSKKGQVHFHEQVRVKKIKATGKNRPLNGDDDDDDDDDFEDDHEDDNMEGFQFDGEEDEEDDDDDDDEDKGMDWRNDAFGSSDNEEEEDESADDESQMGDETMTRLKNDLFAEDEEIPDDLTTHERRMAALKEQISDLENENIAPKEWVLMGEAASRQRPQNSLLEEDLEFERVMKAVPVTTEESVKSLEEKIKARILEGRYDDVIRIRPLEDKPFLPSRLLELNDSKSTQSLAQIYENDYVASQTGVPTDDRDGKLKKEHEEIDMLWDKICSKLDALCNAHFVPKQAKAMISTVSNTATATLESALPTSVSTSSMLAPEEVFSASTSSLRARSELTPAEKRTHRARERKAKKKQRDSLEKSVDKFAKSKGIGGIKKQKQAALESVVKHGKGVTVVGKKGITGSKDKRKK